MEIQTATQQFCDYSIFVKNYSSSTIFRYKTSIKIFSKDVGVNDIAEITEKKVREWFLDGRINKHWTPSTFITYHKSLLVFFRWCNKQGLLPNNPAEDIEMPKLFKKLPVKLTKQESMRLLEYVYNYPWGSKFLRQRNHAIFATFIFSGLRKSELLHLNYADVDVENMTIFVRQGKGKKDRIIPMAYRLADILQKYITERNELQKTCPEFFASFTNDRGFSESGLRHLVRHTKRRSKINFGMHRLRHTFATLMLEGGCDIYSLSKMMGHSDIKTTTIYLSATTEHLRGQMIKHPLNNM